MLASLLLLAPEDALAQQEQWPGQPQYIPNYAQTQSYPQAEPPQQYSQPAPQQAYPEPYADQAPPEQAYAPQGGDDYGQPQAQPQALDAAQLEQLVAPIALYPDGLVAQILAAATYPAQVVAADHWLQAQGYASPDQVVAGANAQAWDPSVKALTAFPQVLAQMDQNLQWTTDLGNAYYNQPQDVLQTIQVMRQRAQAAGNLESTPQAQVSEDQGYIQVAPPSPQVVYVPTYNPWVVYGAPVAAYPGFSFVGALGSFFGGGVRWGMGMAMSAFFTTPWGWLGWGLNWLSHSVLFQHSAYYSRSTSVARWGSPRGYPSHGFGGRASGAYARGAQGYGRPGYGYGRQPGQAFARGAEGRPSAGFARPQQPAYSRFSQPARPQQYAMARPYGGGSQLGRPGYALGYPSRPAQDYARPAESYPRSAPSYSSRPVQGFSYRAPAASEFRGGSGRENFGGRAFSGRESSGGSHMFGGGHSEGFHGGGHAPKSFGHSGGGHSGGHGGGRHH